MCFHRRVVDVEKDFCLGTRDRDVALAAESIEDTAHELDLVTADTPRLERLSAGKRTFAFKHRLLHLVQCEGRKTLRTRTRLLHDLDQNLELGRGLYRAVARDARHQPVGVLLVDKALGLDLLDQVVGDCLAEELAPGRVMRAGGLVDRK